MKTPVLTKLLLAALLGLAASSAFSAPLSEKKQASIQSEMSQVMQKYLATAEHLDCAGILRFHADVPEFRYADIDGKQYNHAGCEKNTTDLFAGLSALKCTLRNQQIHVLGTDTALVIWHGALDLTQKDASVLHWDDYNATFLFQRLGGAWKIVFQHESALPPQPAKPAASPAAAATDTTRSVLRMLDDYFAAVNARELTRFLDFFVDTEDMTVFEEKDLRLSRKEFVAFVDGFFKDVSQIQATWEQRAVHELAPNAAVVTGTFKVDGKDAKGAPMAFRNAFTFVLVKQGERWLVKHVHESSLNL